VQGGIIRSLHATTLAELVQFSAAPAERSPIAATAITPTQPLTVAAPASH
jgi:hypothetical protein